MTRGAGVLRSAESLEETAAVLDKITAHSWELLNLVTVASALVGAAAMREETRGCHWREDFPEASPAWRGHVVAKLNQPHTWEAMA